MEAEDRDRMRRLLVARLESLQSAGVMQLPRASQSASFKVGPSDESANISSAKADSPSTAHSACRQSAAKKGGWQSLGAETLFGGSETGVVQVSTALTLQALQQEVAGCTRCDELARTRTQTVFGVGNGDARLCFVGEAPGADEDKHGEPFVGRAGQLLNKIIEACRMKREDVYILNMIKCRPPGNRNPLPEELSNCAGYLERQLSLVRPEFICCLGAVAAQNLLGTTLSIGKLRGKVHLHRGAKIVCTYHPAYLLRNPAAKKDTWDDMKLLMREMGVEL
jgi:DNA polymerase